jgi:ABC-type bacteriocin/lantibiotic exporter with double-glycine peptidase domain
MTAKTKQLREILGLTCGAIATFLTLSVSVLVVIFLSLMSALVLLSVKLLCLPLVVLASLISPDDRHRPLLKRIAEDAQAWWRLMRVEA